MPAIYTHKRGDTFALAGRLAGGGVTDWSSYRLRCQIRTGADVVLHDFGAIEPSADGSFTLTIPAAATAAWPVANPRLPASMAFYDIEVSDPSGVVRSTETAQINIVADITRG